MGIGESCLSMSVPKPKIEANLRGIQARVAAAAARAGRLPGEVRLIAVTKTVGLDEALALRQLGVDHFGENRVEHARAKVIELLPRPVWHMIGTVQRRKARDVAAIFDCVDSVDRVELAEALSRACQEAGKTLHVLVQCNTSGEEAKHGFTPEALPAALDAVRALPGLAVEGLMTMAPLVDDPETVRPCFARLRELAERHGLRELSMGMTNDFEVAVEEGATQIRIGSALYT